MRLDQIFFPFLFLCFFFLPRGHAGVDERYQHSEVSGASEWIERLAKNVGVAVSKKKVKPDFSGGYLIELSDSSDKKQKNAWYNWFFNEPQLGECSGFLFGPTELATAGHCVARIIKQGEKIEAGNYCRDFYWVFDLTADRIDWEKRVVRIPKENVYECTTGTVQYHPFEIKDGAVLKLDRPVKLAGELEFQKGLSIESSDDSSGSVFMIGSPSGRPLKVSSFGKVLRSRHQRYFTADLFAYRGNSGSPVISAATGGVLGIFYQKDIAYGAAEKKGDNQYDATPEQFDPQGIRGYRVQNFHQMTKRERFLSSVEEGDLTEVKKLMRTYFMDVNIYNSKIRTPVMVATRMGHCSVLDYLLRLNANLSMGDGEGRTFFDYLKDAAKRYPCLEQVAKNNLGRRYKIETKELSGALALRN